MKKIGSILLLLLLICGVTTVSFAKTMKTRGAMDNTIETMLIKGIITSIDKVKNEIVVKSGQKEVLQTITVDPKVISSLKTDDEVQITLNKSDKTALSVKKIVKNDPLTQK